MWLNQNDSLRCILQQFSLVILTSQIVRCRTGENPRNQRQVKPCMYQNKTAESAARDPVQVLITSLQR